MLLVFKMNTSIGCYVLLNAERSSSVALAVPTHSQAETEIPKIEVHDNINVVLITAICLTMVLLALAIVICMSVSKLCHARQNILRKRSKRLPKSKLIKF